MSTALGAATTHLSAVTESLHGASRWVSVVQERFGQLEQRVTDAEAENRELARRLSLAEQEAARMMGLYVATYQLHSTMDPEGVRGKIAEIAVNMVGAQQFVLLLRSGGHGPLDVVMAEGMSPNETRYAGGDPLVDAALDDGVVRLGPDPASNAVAVVPLVVQEATVGALVINKLFAHKNGLSPQDLELLDEIGAHAAAALCAVQVHAAAERKIRTLESLVQLARRE